MSHELVLINKSTVIVSYLSGIQGLLKLLKKCRPWETYSHICIHVCGQRADECLTWMTERCLLSDNMAWSLGFCALPATAAAWRSGTHTCTWGNHSGDLTFLSLDVTAVAQGGTFQRGWVEWEGLKCVFCKDTLVVKKLNRKSSWPDFLPDPDRFDFINSFSHFFPFLCLAWRSCR